jgi:hypothetical protein
MKIRDVLAVGRVIDPTYPTNLAIVLLSMVASVAGTIWHLVSGGALLDSALWGIAAGFVLSLTWALGRELDPDHDLSAFVGVGLALVALLLVDRPPLLVFVWLLVVLRIVNRTSGVPARFLDTLGVLTLGAWLIWQGNWMVGLITAVALLLDGLLPQPLRPHLFVSGLAFAGTVVLSIFHGDMVMESGATMPVTVASVAMAGLFMVVIATSRKVRTVGDATGEPLNPLRVQAAQALALATALLYAWWEGASGLAALYPVWAAMVGVGLYRLVSLLVPSSRRTEA